MNEFLKYFTIIFWSQIVYLKSINYKISYREILIHVFFSVILCISIYFIDNSMFLMAIPLIVILSSIFNKFLSKKQWTISIFITTISYGIGFAFHTISTLIISLLITIAMSGENYETIAPFISFAIIGFFVIRLFKIRRLKTGFPFLHSAKSVSIGAVISSIVIISYITIINYISNNEVLSDITLILFAFIILCFVLIILWWRAGITRTYTERIRMDEIQRLKAAVEELEKDNRALAQIIHKDNKLLGAMELAVRSLVEAAKEINVDISEKAAPILEQLQEETGDRKGIIREYRKNNKTLSETGVSSIDDMLNYMLQKANEADADFDVIVMKNIKRLTEDIIDKEKLRTLIADLLENAIIATKNQEHKKVLLRIGVEDGGDASGAYFALTIYDSGAYFDAEVLQNLGKKQITTHAGDGGSGIGIMQTFEILNETKASIMIEEFPQAIHSFTKKITIRFDGKNEVRVKAPAAI